MVFVQLMQSSLVTHYVFLLKFALQFCAATLAFILTLEKCYPICTDNSISVLVFCFALLALMLTYILYCIL